MKRCEDEKERKSTTTTTITTTTTTYLLTMHADLDYNLPNSKLPLTFVKLLTINFNWAIIYLFASIFFFSTLDNQEQVNRLKSKKEERKSHTNEHLLIVHTKIYLLASTK